MWILLLLWACARACPANTSSSAAARREQISYHKKNAMQQNSISFFFLLLLSLLFFSSVFIFSFNPNTHGAHNPRRTLAPPRNHPAFLFRARARVIAYLFRAYFCRWRQRRRRVLFAVRPHSVFFLFSSPAKYLQFFTEGVKITEW